MLQSSILHDILSGTKENIVIAIKYFEYFCNIVEIFVWYVGTHHTKTEQKTKQLNPNLVIYNIYSKYNIYFSVAPIITFCIYNNFDDILDIGLPVNEKEVELKSTSLFSWVCNLTPINSI